MHVALKMQLAAVLMTACLSEFAAAGTPIKLIRKNEVVIVTETIVSFVGYTSTIWARPPPSSPPAKVESASPTPEAPTPVSATQAPSSSPVVQVPEVEPIPEPQPSPEPQPVQESASGGGEVFSGKATFYDAGLGSCGQTHSNTDFICALSKITMALTAGPNPNLNPMCGTKIRVRSASNSEGVIVTIVDTCPGCSGPNDLDLSPAAFDQLGRQEDGVIAITWERV